MCASGTDATWHPENTKPHPQSRLHETHQLAALGQYIFCEPSGYYVTSSASLKAAPRRLTTPGKPLTASGRQYLARFRKLLPPKPSCEAVQESGLKAWEGQGQGRPGAQAQGHDCQQGAFDPRAAGLTCAPAAPATPHEGVGQDGEWEPPSIGPKAAPSPCAGGQRQEQPPQHLHAQVRHGQGPPPAQEGQPQARGTGRLPLEARPARPTALRAVGDDKDKKGVHSSQATGSLEEDERKGDLTPACRRYPQGALPLQCRGWPEG